MTIAVLGSGAFGTALAICLARTGQDIVLWGRDPDQIETMRQSRQNPKRLPGVDLPPSLTPVDQLGDASKAEVLLLVPPAQQLPQLLAQLQPRPGQALIACCKGLNVETGQGPVQILRDFAPESTAAILTGPSFAADIAKGLPTALTLATSDLSEGQRLQGLLATPSLRLYLTQDTAGAELGGAMKNVVAIACGVTIGAGLGDSARAAVMTRGFAEMQRLAPHYNASPETLTGLSGFGDLALSCTSDLSRNYQLGLALGEGRPFDNAITVEGAWTAQALAQIADREKLDLPIAQVIAALVSGKVDVKTAMQGFMSRPLKEE